MTNDIEHIDTTGTTARRTGRVITVAAAAAAALLLSGLRWHPAVPGR